MLTFLHVRFWYSLLISLFTHLFGPRSALTVYSLRSKNSRVIFFFPFLFLPPLAFSFIFYRDDERHTPLFQSAIHGCPVTTDALLHYGADINSLDKNRVSTPPLLTLNITRLITPVIYTFGTGCSKERQRYQWSVVCLFAFSTDFVQGISKTKALFIIHIFINAISC